MIAAGTDVAAQLATIRAGLDGSATESERAAAVHVLDTLAVALVPAPAPAAASIAQPLAMLVAAARAMPADQLLDVAIAKLRTLVPGVVEPMPSAFAPSIVPLVRE